MKNYTEHELATSFGVSVTWKKVLANRLLLLYLSLYYLRKYIPRPRSNEGLSMRLYKLIIYESEVFLI